MAINIAISTVVSEELQEPFTYKQMLASFKAKLQKQAINEEKQALEDNHSLHIINLPFNAKILDSKQVYKVKPEINSQSSTYKAGWIVKNYDQIYGIDFEEIYIADIKTTTYQILFDLIAYFFGYEILIDTMTAFLNSRIDVTVYAVAYKILQKYQYNNFTLENVIWAQIICLLMNQLIQHCA